MSMMIAAAMMAYLVSPVVGFGPAPTGCTKRGCWFSYTNIPTFPNNKLANFGRCGEVDAAPRMPKDIWADQKAVDGYVSATIRYYSLDNNPNDNLGLDTGKCSHDPLRWYRSSELLPDGTHALLNLSTSWTGRGSNGFAQLCQSQGCVFGGGPQNDDPTKHIYCSLCGAKPYNANILIDFWYPRSTTQNIVQVAEAQPSLSTLVTAVVDGNLANLLESPGPFTVFAPNNDAFAKLPPLVLKKLLEPENVKTLDRILEIHVVNGRVLSSALRDGQQIKTVSGETITVTITGKGTDTKIFIGSEGTKASQVIAANVLATNGVVHVVDSVLLPGLIPPSPPGSNNIVDVASATSDLSTLVTALKAGDLVDTLSGPGPFTVFAPSDEAFSALPAGVLANLLKPENKAQLVDLLTYHVVAGAAVLASQLKDGETIPTVEGKSVDVRIIAGSGVFPDTIFIDSAKVTTPNVNASNGVIHIIDEVLIPPAPPPGPPTITATVAAIPDFSTLSTALTAALLDGTLSSTGPFTVFAPTNEAFAALPAGVLANLLKPENRPELAAILKYHVVAGTFALPKWNGSPQSIVVETLEGNKLTIINELQPGSGDRHLHYYVQDGSRNDGGTNEKLIRLGKMNGGPTKTTCGNGVIYTIGEVLTIPLFPPPPKPQSIAEIAVGNKDLSTLVLALKAGGLVSTLNNTGPPAPFTVFAPTNAAFASLPSGVLSSLLLPQNKAKLVDLLTYHVVAGAAVLASQLSNGEMIKTLEGQNVTVSIFSSTVEINKAIVIIPNVGYCPPQTGGAPCANCTNGVVHVVNGVLIPPNFKIAARNGTMLKLN